MYIKFDFLSFTNVILLLLPSLNKRHFDGPTSKILRWGLFVWACPSVCAYAHRN